MNQVYFIVKVSLDQNGKPVPGSERYVSAITDTNVIRAAELANKVHRDKSKGSHKSIIMDAVRRIRTTIPELLAVKD